jgi:hypothetical protein
LIFQAFETSKTPTRDLASGGGFDRLTQPSPTINTKEAFSLMQQIWGKSADSSNGNNF